ncbi:MAG: MBL fold metallo-hydrolase [Lachnospiraceae bacterium]|jgi:L-ascorbate 6-phosphate lactonase|nr:MBL fold metallo-hydrolase [Lachnospiraceae bacterium]
MNNFACRVLTARTGQTHIFAVGQAGYIIKSAEGCLLAIDLYLSECVERFEGHKGFKRLLPQILNPYELEFDYIVCTHAHLDHFDVDAVPGMISNGRTKLLCSVNCAELIKQLQMKYHENQIVYVKPGDECNAGDFHIHFVNCDHGVAAPDAFGVDINVDGKRIYDTGDTCLRLDRIHEIITTGAVDMLIAPINGTYGNLNEEECCCLAKALQPSITVPCHYGMFASHHGDVGRFYHLMTEKGLPMLLMRQGEMYTL